MELVIGVNNGFELKVAREKIASIPVDFVLVDSKHGVSIECGLIPE